MGLARYFSESGFKQAGFSSWEPVFYTPMGRHNLAVYGVQRDGRTALVVIERLGPKMSEAPEHVLYVASRPMPEPVDDRRQMMSLYQDWVREIAREENRVAPRDLERTVLNLILSWNYS